jgi:hypothetical protein
VISPQVSDLEEMLWRPFERVVKQKRCTSVVKVDDGTVVKNKKSIK